jgi:hypothetical protein
MRFKYVRRMNDGRVFRICVYEMLQNENRRLNGRIDAARDEMEFICECQFSEARREP